MDNLVLVVNRDLDIVFANSGFGKFRNRRASDFTGKPLRQALAISDDQWNLLQGELKEGENRGGPAPDHREHRHDPACVETRDPLHAVQNPGGPFNPPSVVTLGEKIFTYQVFEMELEDASGPGLGLVFNDLTREKEFLDRMTQVENTANLKTLVAGIAHEISNPLQSVQSFSEAMMVENDSGKLQEYAAKVRAGSERIGKIISRVSGWVQNKSAGARERLEVRDTLETALAFALLPFEQNRIDVEYDMVGEPVLMADPDDVKQIWVNILNNAVQAMQGRGALKIAAHAVDAGVRVSIKDTGPGMNRETLRKMFNPFFTTKMQGEGTGLGLSITQRLVEKYGGRIEVDSAEGSGTTVHVWLPAGTGKNRGSPAGDPDHIS